MAEPTVNQAGDRERALRRIVSEIQSGLRHGYFDFTVTCELIGQGRRRLVLRAGKHYQFVIAADECAGVGNRPSDLQDEGAANGHV